jgi:hypothetical protein
MMTDTFQTLLPGAMMVIQGTEIRPLVYLTLATTCAYLGSSTSLARRTPRNLQQLWLLLSPLYFLAACNALLHADTAWVLWARSFARAQNSYELRRLFQSIILMVLLLLLAAGWKTLHRTRRASSLRILIVAGACGTLVLHILRYVSLHYTDLALNAMLLNHSVASWVEFSSLGLVATGTALELLRSKGLV